MQPQINKGELALAQIGISPILKGDMPQVGLGRLREMAEIPDKIERLANKVTLGSLSYTTYAHEHAYATLLARLSRETKPAELQSWIDHFPAEASDIATAFSIAVQEAIRDLKDVFPVSVYRTFAGPKNLEPSRDKQGYFLNQLDVVNDPLRVFPLISSGALLRSQAAIVHRVYPTMSSAIDFALREAAAKRRGASPESKPYQLPPRAEVGVAVWFGDPLSNLRAPAPPIQPPNLPQSHAAQRLATPAQTSAAPRNP